MALSTSPPWLDSQEYPFTSRFFIHQGHRLHYIQEGAGPVLLFVHGTPSWSFDFRNVIKVLTPHFRCIALDHMGFGLSDKPKGYDYSTLNHASTLESLIKHLDLKEINLVMHDFGGPIGMAVALRHPRWIQSLVVLNSWLWSAEEEPEFKKMKWLLKSPLLPFLYKQLNFSPRFILPSVFGDKKLSPNLRKQYTSPFPMAADRSGPLAFARSLLHDQAWFEHLWQQRSALAEKPMALIWGMKDPVIKPAHLKKFSNGFPQSKVFELPQAGHFPQEEEPFKVAEIILDFRYVNQCRLVKHHIPSPLGEGRVRQ
jgi:pimeloyl-ACP methyl ester carboxylesterase